MRVSRKTRAEQRYSPGMGVLETKVTYIRRTLAGIPFRTIHKYRETYYGKIKDCKQCELTR